MTILVIGLGSMGKRRIRCLRQLGYNDIEGFDTRSDRLLPDMRCYDVLPGLERYTHIFICTPPDMHTGYMIMAEGAQIPYFVEHGIEDTGINSQYGTASATMLFHPYMAHIASLKGVSNVIYHCGQYLPDWHPSEPVNEFYVSKPKTGAAREIVPFELTWMCHVWGIPSGNGLLPRVKGMKAKTIDIPGAPDIDDTYNVLLNWGDKLGVLTVDVVSRPAIRRLLITTDKEQYVFNLTVNESIYVNETKAFMDGEFPYTMAQDRAVLQLLQEIEA